MDPINESEKKIPVVAEPEKSKIIGPDGKEVPGEGNLNPPDPAKDQTKEDNAKFAAQRREQEKQQAIREAEKQAILLATDGVNPYTKKPIIDTLDVEEYKVMKKLAKEGKDPIAAYPETIKQQKKQNAESEAARVTTEESTKKDIAAFKAKHPDVNLPDLMKDETFRIVAKYALGRQPLTQIYDDYQALLKKLGKAPETAQVEEDLQKQARIEANKTASPGSLAKPADTQGDFYTVDQIRKMSQKDVDANFDKVQKSLRHFKIIA